MLISDAVSSEGPKTTGIQQRLSPCPLRAEISPVSLNLLMMLCTVDDEICKAFVIWHWGKLFLKYSTIFYALFHRLESLCPSFTSERLCLSKACVILSVSRESAGSAMVCVTLKSSSEGVRGWSARTSACLSFFVTVGYKSTNFATRTSTIRR